MKTVTRDEFKKFVRARPKLVASTTVVNDNEDWMEYSDPVYGRVVARATYKGGTAINPTCTVAYYLGNER